jgi:hypothetical protein
MTIPYENYRKITSQQQLEDYEKEIENGLRIYGDPKHQPSPINKEDALLIARNEKGREIKLKLEYYMTPEGHKYCLKENKGTFKKINVRENKGRYQLTLADESKKFFKTTHLQLWSYYPHLDWKPFCENLKNNGGNNDASVDHIKQEHKACHYKYLEAVPISENCRRSGLFNDKEQYKKAAQSRCKPFTIKLDGEQIGGVFHSGNAVDYLSKEHKINIDSACISRCLNGNRKTAYKKRLTFEYTEDYLNIQKDFDDEIWKKMEEWCQKEEIINRYKRRKKGLPPKAISNKGRIKTNTGKITNGSQVKGSNHSRYNGVDLSMLVWEAFSVEVIGNLCLLHDDKHDSNKKDENDKVIRYSNWFETLRLGTNQENRKDMSKEMQRVAEHNPENEFIVRNKDGIEVMRSHYVPECVDELNKDYPDITFRSSAIHKCLKKELKTHQGFTFKKVIPRT